MIHSCPEGWISSPNGCFFFAIDVLPKSWYEAVEYCDAIGGYLAEVLNEETQRFLVEQAIVLGSSNNWWLGATDLKRVSFLFWYTVRPDLRMTQPDRTILLFKSIWTDPPGVPGVSKEPKGHKD